MVRPPSPCSTTFSRRWVKGSAMHRECEIHNDPLDARQFEIAARRLANSLSYGQERSIFLGAGVEYVQSRPYVDGDPVKTMDWKVTARTGRHHVKEYEAPRRIPIYLLVDTSASMCVSSTRVSKYAWAVRLAGGLALAALDHMNPVGMLAVGDRELHHPPSLSRTDVMQWMHALRRHHYTEKTRLGKRLRELAPRTPNRSLFFILSDLHDPDAIPALKLLAQHHDTAVLRLIDPAEKGRLGGGIFRATEAETGNCFVSHGRTSWPSPVDTAALKRSGVDLLDLPLNGPIVARLRHFIQQRAAHRRMG